MNRQETLPPPTISTPSTTATTATTTKNATTSKALATPEAPTSKPPEIEVKPVKPTESKAQLPKPPTEVETANNIALFTIQVVQDLLTLQLVNPITSFNNIIALSIDTAYLNAGVKEIPLEPNDKETPPAE